MLETHTCAPCGTTREVITAACKPARVEVGLPDGEKSGVTSNAEVAVAIAGPKELAVAMVFAAASSPKVRHAARQVIELYAPDLGTYPPEANTIRGGGGGDDGSAVAPSQGSLPKPAFATTCATGGGLERPASDRADRSVMGLIDRWVLYPRATGCSPAANRPEQLW